MKLACLIVAFILFLLAAFNVPTGGRANLSDLGLAFATLSFLWGTF